MIQLQQLSVVYNHGALTALQPTTIDFRRGEFTVLLGASGAGKTTLLRSINLLTRPSSGSVSVAGELIERGRALREHRRN
ncbi:MAG TPA: ATP-binding cassette domain-containing protein, partial [Candidatus Tenderia sp.]|nr:ATP-binding cassette domain-containing protein [Candidatus Tenderia sp.]